MMRKQIAVAVVLALSAACAQAADETGKWYVNPQLGYLWTDSMRRVDDDIYYGAGFGKHVSQNWSIEANALSGKYDNLVGTGDLKIDTFSVDALRVFRRESSVAPYLSLGVGFINDNPSTRAGERSELVQIGAGLLIDLMENQSGSFVMQLRPEVKARWDFVSQPGSKYFTDYMAGIGLQFSFGPARPAPAPMAAAAPPPPPVAVTPPPPPVVVVPPPPPKDTDGDGVVDSRDQCPTTPRGEPVDAVGCGFSVRLAVQFENNSAKLKPESMPDLDAAAALLNRVTSITGVIEGHTDNVGAEAYNQKLSQQRAQAVTDYLVSKGVSSSRLQAKGFGESQPEADNATAEGRAKNRRVILRRTDAK